MVKRKFEFGLSNGFCTMGGAISGEKKELSCQVTRNMGKLPLYRDKCHILRQCHKIIVTGRFPEIHPASKVRQANDQDLDSGRD
jgi:hypothetical protein